MKYRGLQASLLGLVCCVSQSFAGDIGGVSSGYQRGFYAGLGGSYNWIGNAYHVQGTLNALAGAPPLGVFTGSSHYGQNQQTLTPEVQVGYFKPWAASDWLWGLELRYQISTMEASLSSSTAKPNASVNLIDAGAATTDLISLGGRQTRIRGELYLPVFLGHAFASSFLYAGVGPALFDTRYVLNSADNLSGFYLGQVNTSNNKWLWGGLLELGGGYYLNSTWFLKIDYTYARSGGYSLSPAAGFSSGVNGGLNSGNVAYNVSSHLTAQELSLSINKVF